MKAAVYHRYGPKDVIEIEEIGQPSAGKKEVLIHVKAAGLNPKDILVRKGKFKKFTGSSFPMTMGYEFSGLIADSNNSGLFHNGDHVFGMVNGWKGRCMAEYVNVSVNELFYIPRNQSDGDMAGVALAGQTALQAIRDLGKISSGQKICINGGSGGVGTLAIQIAKILGAEVTSVSSAANMDFCASLGADFLVDYKSTNLLEYDDQFDVFFDVFGNYSFKKIKNLLSPKGIYVTTVPQKEIFKEQLYNSFRPRKAKLVFVKSKTNDLKWLHDHIEFGDLKPIVERTYNLDNIRGAHAQIETKRSKGKVIIEL